MPSHSKSGAVVVKVQDARDGEMHPGDRTRDRLALRCQRLDEAAPEALDLAAEALTVLRERFRGRAAEVSGEHAPQYWRAVLRGDHALRLEDLSRLALEAPVDVALCLAVILGSCGYAVTPYRGDESGESLASRASRAVRAAADLVSAAMDGPDEARVSTHLEHLKRSAADVEEALWAARKAEIARETKRRFANA